MTILPILFGKGNFQNVCHSANKFTTYFRVLVIVSCLTLVCSVILGFAMYKTYYTLNSCLEMFKKFEKHLVLSRSKYLLQPDQDFEPGVQYYNFSSMS